MVRLLLFISILLLITGCEAPPRDPDVPRSISATDGFNGTLTLTHPGDWYALVASDSAITLGNSGAALSRFENDITQLVEDQVAGSVTAILKSAMPDTVENTPIGVIRFVTGQLATQTSGVRYTFGLPVEGLIGERDVAISDGLATDPNDESDVTDDVVLELRMMVLDVGDAYAMMFFGAPFDHLLPAVPTLESIAESIVFTPIEGQ